MKYYTQKDLLKALTIISLEVNNLEINRHNIKSVYIEMINDANSGAIDESIKTFNKIMKDNLFDKLKN